MIYAMADIHGNYDYFLRRIKQIESKIVEEGNRLILLGDYIDRGPKSYECLKLAYDLEQKYGTEKVVVLKGNHEVWFEEFLFENEDVWLSEDDNYCTSGTFLSEGQIKELESIFGRENKIDYIRNTIRQSHEDLLEWMRKLRLYYETDKQIFVHAGVDESVPEEEAEWVTLGTPDYVMTGKYPPTKGYFYKDIIAGHVAASHLAHDKGFMDIFFDGASHYYIDGSTSKFRRVLCLVYDEKEKKYYQLEEDGSMKNIRGHQGQ